MQISLIFTIIAQICGECPNPDLLKPCHCDKDSIFCGGHNSIDLKNIFHNLSSTLKSDKKHFKSFSLNNTAIKELPENTFGDITFESLFISNAPNLTSIHTKAFSGTDTHRLTYEFNIYNTSLKNSPPNYDIFQAFSSMVNIKNIYLTQNKIEEIPDYAFKPINGPENTLNLLYITDDTIKRIGNFAFQDLNHLYSLTIDSNKVNYISKNAFSFEESSDSLIDIDLSNLPLKGDSFEIGAFGDLKRPARINLSSRDGKRIEQVTFLDQQVFEEFFIKNPRNKLILNTVDCNDCRSYWLVKTEKYSSQTDEMRCSDDKILDKFFEVFPNCEHFN